MERAHKGMQEAGGQPSSSSGAASGGSPMDIPGGQLVHGSERAGGSEQPHRAPHHRRQRATGSHCHAAGLAGMLAGLQQLVFNWLLLAGGARMPR